MTTIRKIKGEAGTLYTVLFVDQQGHLIVGLTEWYRVRTQQGPASTRDTYLACLLPFFAFLSEPAVLGMLPPNRYASRSSIFTASD